MQTIARISSATSRVVNIEVVPDGWIEANADPNGPFLFVPYDDTNPATIGGVWHPIGGFVHEGDPSTFVLTGAELVDLGVTEAAVDKLTADKVAAVELAAVELVTADTELAAEATPTKGTR